MRAPACVSVACAFHGPNAFESKQSLAAAARGSRGNRNAAAMPTRRPSARRRVFSIIARRSRFEAVLLADTVVSRKRSQRRAAAFAVPLPPINRDAEKRALLPRINPFATALRPLLQRSIGSEARRLGGRGI
jgi:hypothetical protein